MKQWLDGASIDIVLRCNSFGAIRANLPQPICKKCYDSFTDWTRGEI